MRGKDKNPWIEVEVDLDRLAEQLAGWTNEQLLKLIQEVDDAKRDADFVKTLYPWVRDEYRHFHGDQE
jgi:sugar diacid utilization regulator